MDSHEINLGFPDLNVLYVTLLAQMCLTKKNEPSIDDRSQTGYFSISGIVLARKSINLAMKRNRGRQMTEKDFNLMEISNLDRLAAALFEGETVATDFKAMPGPSTDHSVEESARVLYESMQRMGIIQDGHIVKIVD